MNLTGCTQEEAEQALRECNNDPVDAVDKLLKVPESQWNPKRRKLDETQTKFAEMRTVLETMNTSIEAGFKNSNQHDGSSSRESLHSLARPLEELSSDSLHTPQNQITIPELKEQTQETACPSRSE